MKLVKKIAILIIFLNLIINFALKAQDINLVDLENKNTSLEQVASSDKVVLLIWTTWCPYCKKEVVHLDRDIKKYPDINFFLVNIGENEKKVKRFIQDLKLVNISNQHILLDKNQQLPQEFSISGIPVYLLFKDGKFKKTSHFIDESVITEVFSAN